MIMKDGVPTFSIFDSPEELEVRKINGLKELQSLARECVHMLSELGNTCKGNVEKQKSFEDFEVYHFLSDIDNLSRRLRDMIFYLKGQTEKFVKM